MPDAAQNTLGLFDSTALGWTVDTPRAEPEPLAATSGEPDAESVRHGTAPPMRGRNFYLEGDRGIARGWTALAEAVSPAEYAALQRASQYAHYTPEPIIRALWRAARHLGFTAGRVLEPGMGTGLFFALLPEELRETTRLTGIEYCAVIARIARLVHPDARIRCEDYTRSPLGGGFDLALGNPPFADRIVRADQTTAGLGLRLHDYFIARSIARLRPGGIALFVTSTGTMDKASRTAREHIASMADLIGAVRLPEASMRATAGTDVVIDVLVFQRRANDQAPSRGPQWIDLVEIELQSAAEEAEQDNSGALPESYPLSTGTEPSDRDQRIFRRASRDGARRARAEARHLRA